MNRAISFTFCVLIFTHIALKEVGYITFTFNIEIAMSLAHTIQNTPTLFLKKIIISIEPVEEIHMEAFIESICRVGPFGNHKSMRIFLLKKRSNLSPEQFCSILASIKELFITICM